MRLDEVKLSHFIASRRTRTYNPLIKSQTTDRRNSNQGIGKGRKTITLATSLPHFNSNLPPELAEVVDAWPELPEAIRAGIVAMVRAASGNGGGR